jgi:hypothetical protein
MKDFIIVLIQKTENRILRLIGNYNNHAVKKSSSAYFFVIIVNVKIAFLNISWFKNLINYKNSMRRV